MARRKSLEAKRKPGEKAYPLRNSLYILKIIWEAAPAKIIFQFAASLSNQVYYDVIYSIYFLKSTLGIIERGGSFSELVTTVAVIGCIKIANELLWYWFYQHRNEQYNIKVFRHLNTMMFKKAVGMELACYENTEFYDKFKRARDVAQKDIFRSFMGNLSYILAGLVSAAAMMAYIISVDPLITIVAVCSVMHFVLKRLTAKLEYKKDKEMTHFEREKDYIKRTVFLRDYAKEIKTGGIYNVLQAHFEKAVAGNIRIIKKYGWKAAMLENDLELISGILPTAGGYIYACWRFVVRGDLAVSDFAVLITAITNFKSVLQWVGETLTELYKNCLFAQNLREYMDYEPSLYGGDAKPESFRTLEFRNVSFTYEGCEKPVLSNVSFVINRGERIAIVGHNGAGKTTLSKLMMRLYDVTEGEILLNGINIREYDLEEYRRIFASVFQDYRLFSLTVAENVLMREPETQQDRELVERALMQSGVYDKIAALPQGIDSLLTKEFDNEGSVLSGGEGQKVAIARLFAKQFDFALLDEPSSALDPIAEHDMYEHLIDATQNKTVVYISHRLSSAVMSDRIFVFEQGCLIECGAHEELIEKNGKYAEMFAVQAESYRENREVTA